MFFNYTPLFLFFTKLIKWLENSSKEITICGISSPNNSMATTE